MEGISGEPHYNNISNKHLCVAQVYIIWQYLDLAFSFPFLCLDVIHSGYIGFRFGNAGLPLLWQICAFFKVCLDLDLCKFLTIFTASLQ